MGMTPPVHVRHGRCRQCNQPLAADIMAGLCAGCLARRLGERETHLSAAPPGVQLPPGFECVELLGRGGMGEVYLAYQPRLARYVALKQLSVRWQDDPRRRGRFLREAQAAARLSHPGIVPILETSAEAGPIWYTMEYVEGGDVADLLARNGGRLPWRVAATLVHDVAAALQHAHAAGVAHRDLKPSNILRTSEGQPKVADFGLAWLAATDGKDLTATGEVLGTPAYLAPETISAGAREFDARRSDLYSLGAVLFHLVAGRPPFSGTHAMEILAGLGREPAPRLSAIAPERIPATLDAICARCLEKNPAKRIASAEELRQALGACLVGEPLPGSEACPWHARRRFVVAGLAALALAGTANWWERRGADVEAPARAARPPPLVAVFPLETIDADPALSLLAEGLQEELVATLTRMTDLRVIATRSVRKANPPAGDFRSARTTLGAEAVLAARLRKVDDQVWVSVHWIDTEDGTARWSRTYIRREANALNLQTDIATEIAVYLHRGLRETRPDAARGLSSKAPEAQARFLRARALATDASDSVGQLAQAETLLREAVAIDPDFALAHAHLSLVHTQMYNWGNDRTERRLALGLESAQAALRLNPDLAEAEIAIGHYYFRGSRDFNAARPHLDRAFALSPRHPGALEALAHVERRQGLFQPAAQHFVEAHELDPLNAILAYNTVDTFLRLRDYERASALLERSLTRMPKHVALVKLRGDLHVAWKGDLGPMQADIAGRNPALPTPDLFLMDKIEWLTLEHRLDDALRALRESRLAVLEGQSIYLVRDGYEALLLALAGRTAEARAMAERALAPLRAELQRRPNDPRVLMHAGQLNALCGDLATAEAQVQRILTPGDLARADAFDRGHYLRARAILLALAGDDEAARAAIRDALADPNQTSRHHVALHPALARYAQDFP